MSDLEKANSVAAEAWSAVGRESSWLQDGVWRHKIIDLAFNSKGRIGVVSEVTMPEGVFSAYHTIDEWLGETVVRDGVEQPRFQRLDPPK